MPGICLVDTSVFVEILQVPGMTRQGSDTREELRDKIRAGDMLFLPLATVLETGAHIARHGDGSQRRACARRFVTQVSLSLEGRTPFTPMDIPSLKIMKDWLRDFPDHAGSGRSLADASMIKSWEALCARYAAYRVYIWSLDAHLAAFDRAARL